VSIGVKLALALMFIPILLFLVLVATKTVLPVFPVDMQGNTHSYVFFEIYSKSVLNESILLCLGCLILGIWLVVYQSLDRGLNTLWNEFQKDLEKSLRHLLGRW